MVEESLRYSSEIWNCLSSHWNYSGMTASNKHPCAPLSGSFFKWNWPIDMYTKVSISLADSNHRDCHFFASLWMKSKCPMTLKMCLSSVLMTCLIFGAFSAGDGCLVSVSAAALLLCWWHFPRISLRFLACYTTVLDLLCNSWSDFAACAGSQGNWLYLC